MSKDSMEVLARLANINIKATEICDDWLLLTYDIPCNAEGNRMRSKFLAAARGIGATQHTASVYFMPWTQEAECLALEIAQVGKAYVWTAKSTDKDVAKGLTQDYDRHMKKLLDDIAEHIDKIAARAETGQVKRARKMAEKLEPKLDGLRNAAYRRGSISLAMYADVLHRRLAKF